MVSDLRAVVRRRCRRRSARRTARRVRRPPPARAIGRSRSSRGRRGWRRSACRADRPARRPAAGRGSDAGRRRASARPPVLLVSFARGSLGAAIGARGGNLGFGGSVGSRRGVFKLFRFVLGAAQPRGETVRQFAEGVALDRRQRRHVFRGRGGGNGTTFTGGGTAASAGRSSRNTGGSTRGGTARSRRGASSSVR